MEEPFIKYLITDPEYYGNIPEIFENKLREILKKKVANYVCFRDKTSKNYEQLAKIFVKMCKEYNIEQILLNENIELAKELNCGIHLTSKQFDKIKEAKNNNMYVVVSCHTLRDIEKAQNAYTNAVTYSPIFETPNKGEPIGLAKLKEARSLYDMNIIALGGILTQTQVQQIKGCNVYGFASIRYFL